MRTKSLIMCLLSLVILSGCAGADFSNYASSIDESNQAAKHMLTAYFDKRAADNAAVIKTLTSGSPEQSSNGQMAVVLYTILSQQQDEKIMQQFVPKYIDKPVTNGDIGMAVANNTIPTMVRWGAGAWLGSEIVNGLSGTTLVSGSTMLNGSTVSGTPINSPIDMSTNIPVESVPVE